MFTTTLASNAPFPLYVVCQQRFGFSPTTLTYVFSSYAVGVIGVLVLVGRLSDQIGRRRVIIPALILLGASCALFAVASGTAWLLVARAVQGVATGGSPPGRCSSASSFSTRRGHSGCRSSSRSPW